MFSPNRRNKSQLALVFKNEGKRSNIDNCWSVRSGEGNKFSTRATNEYCGRDYFKHESDRIQYEEKVKISKPLPRLWLRMSLVKLAGSLT